MKLTYFLYKLYFNIYIYRKFIEIFFLGELFKKSRISKIYIIKE